MNPKVFERALEVLSKPKKEPSKAWRNRYRAKHLSGIVTCEYCFETIEIKAFAIVETHCVYFPSKDIAETEGLTCEAVACGDIDYLCAFPIEESS